tara:strand:+ start:42125 stop:43504 length:1380 start_codon:yes stop_codon:yes gene_type:complete
VLIILNVINKEMDFKKSYDGSIFSNSRTITDTISIFNSRNPEITIKELFQVLEFIECIALSNTLYYDAAIPKKSLGKLVQCIEQITKTTDIKLSNIKAFEPDSKIKEELSSESFSSAIQSIHQLIDDEELLNNTPLATSGAFSRERVEIFDKVLIDRSLLKNESLLEQFIHDIQSNRGITGRRFILNLCKKEYEQDFIKFYNFSKSLNVDEKGDFYSKVINTYRSHLLNKYAENAKSAYQPTDYSKWAISEMYSKLAWRDIALRINKETQLNKLIKQETENGFSGEPLIPPFALGALMLSGQKVKGLDLINYAIEDSKKREFKTYRKKLWEASFSSDEEYKDFIKLVDQSMEEYELELFDDKRFSKKISRVVLGTKLPKNVIIDSSVSIGIAAAVAGLQVSTTLGLESVAFAIGNLIYKTTGKRGFISLYKDQSRSFESVNKSRLENRVKHVFGKKLVF